MLQKWIVLASLLFAAPAAPVSAEPIRVVSTLPILASLAREVGGDLVEATSLAKGDQDPHFVSPTPVLMKKTREADLFLSLGLSLDLWADEVVNGSGNSRIFRGQPSFVIASAGIPVLEIPSILSREMGDIHPEGNPHVWLDPLRVKALAENIAKALAAARPDAAATFAANLKRFEARIDESLFGKPLVDLVGGAKLGRLAADGTLDDYLGSNSVDGQPLRDRIGGWLARSRPLRGKTVIEYHKVWIYFAKMFGLELAGEIEERPGIPPGPRHQQQTIELVRSRKIPLILVDNFYDPKLPQHIAAESGAVAVLLPSQVGGEPAVHDIFDLIDLILDRLLGALASKPSVRVE